MPPPRLPRSDPHNPEAARLLHAVDWAATPLGPLQGWPAELRTLANLMVRSKSPQHIVWGPERILLYNDGYIPVLGDRHPAAFGMPFDRVWPDIWDGVAPIVEQTYAGHASYHENHPWSLDRRDHFEQVWISFAYTPVEDEAGTVLGFHCTFHETTQAVRAQQALEHARDELAVVAAQHRLALEAADLGWWQYEPATGLVHHDARYAEIYGVTGPSPRHVDEVNALLNPDDAGRLWSAVMAATTPVDPAPYVADYRIHRPDGQERWLEARGIATFEGEGDARCITSFVGTVADITERRLAEQALAEANQRKDEFLATLAHELRNPLAPIANALQVWPMLDGRPAEVERLRAMMGRQVRQMVRLIDDLLDVSRITRGRIELQRAPLDVRDALQAAIEAQAPFMDTHRHALHVALPSTPLHVDADWGRLVQVFGNLLHNAAKYTPPGGHIRIDAGTVDGEVRVRVQDDGVGIPPDMLESIFAMFTQVDQSLGRTHGGLGIGLTLVRNLVEMHGGRVEAHSQGAARGSTFQVWLPAITAPARVPDAPATAVADAPMQRVLVVDDNRAAADTLVLMLEGLGQQVRAVHDADAALALLADERFDVAFLDIAMPGMDGYALAGAIQARIATPPRLVALTGYGQEDDRRRALDAGFAAHLIKPAGLDALRAVLAP